MCTFNVAAICFRGHPYIWRTTVRHDTLSYLPSLLGGRSIADLVSAHVLQDLFTVVVLVATRVLIGPLDREDRALVVVEATHVVPTAIVVLGVEKPRQIKTNAVSK